MLVHAHLWSGRFLSRSSTRATPEGATVSPLALFLAVQVLVCAFIATPALANDRPGVVRGVVEEANTGKALPGANVAVRRVADSSLVNGTTTDGSGQFVVDDLSTGRYRVVVSFTGYGSASRTVNLTSADPDRDLDPFRLGKTTAQMQGTTVSAQRPAITMDRSKKVYNFEKAQVALSSKSVVDVLRDLPSVRIDFEGNIHLRSSSNVKIHVNGEPLAMEDKALVQYLKSMSGEDVKRVELNTNPSARHDAEGTANIINIVLDRQDGAGLSAGFSGSAGSNGGVDGSGNLGYGTDDWSLYGSYSYRHNENESVESLRRRALSGSQELLLDQSATQTHLYGGHSFHAQIDYTPTEATTLSLISTGNVHEMNNTRQMSTDQRSWESEREQRVGQVHDHIKLDERLSATHKFEEKEHELSADLRYQIGDVEDRVREEKTFTSEPRTSEITGSDKQDGSLKIDYMRPLGSWTMETGYKGSLRWLDEAYTVSPFNTADGKFRDAPVRSDGLEYEEQVHAGYGILNRGIGPVDAEIGLRFEHTQTAINSEVEPPKVNQYSNFFPSASLNYTLNKGSRLTLSYTNRADRPGTFQLSAFTASDDPYTKYVGNPELDPEQIHKGELAFMQNVGIGSLTLTPYISRTTDAIDWKTVRSDSVTVRTFENYDSNTSYGTELTTSLQFGDDVKANLSGNLYRRVMRGGGTLDAGAAHTSVAFMSRANVTWTPRSDVRLQWSQFYRSPITSGIGRRDAMTRSSLSVEKTFWDEKGSFGLRVEDPFNTSEIGYQNRTQSFRERLTRDWEARSLSISFSYQFGNSDKKRQPHNTGGEMMMGGG